MNKIRIGIVGSGGMAKRRAEVFSQAEGCDLIAVAARNPETGPPLAGQYGVDHLTDWQALIDRRDVDAVAICTHNEIHGAIAISALEMGKHVFIEYPIARFPEETKRLTSLAETASCVIRVAHSENVSTSHRALKARVHGLGDLLAALFQRLTPGRGARPDVLFNLTLSGPPALFFVYHIYPLVDLFGPTAWVECGAEYVGLKGDGRYNRFVNTVTAGFENGGLGRWTWAGGIDIHEAEESRRIVLTGGTLIGDGGKWRVSTPAGVEDLPPAGEAGQTLETQFLSDITEGGDEWRPDAVHAINAAQIGLAAE